MFSLKRKNDNGNLAIDLIPAMVVIPIICLILFYSVSLSFQLGERPMMKDAAQSVMPEIVKTIDELKVKSGGVVYSMKIEPSKDVDNITVSYGSETMIVHDTSGKLNNATFDAYNLEDGSYRVVAFSSPIPFFMSHNEKSKGATIASYSSNTNY